MRRSLPLLLFAILLAGAAWILIQELDPGQDAGTDLALPVAGAVQAAGTAEPPAAREAEAATEFTNRPVKVGAGTHRLPGRVVDEIGAPVPGAWVAAYSVPMPLLDFEFDIAEIFEKPLEFDLEPLASTFADEQGEFSLEGLLGRTLYLTARTHKRLTPRRIRIVPAHLDAEEGIVLRTVAAAELSGRVVDASGAPVAGAEVLVGPGIKYLIAAFRNRTFFMERVYTGPSGEFHVEAVPANIPLTANGFHGPVRSGLEEFGPLAPNGGGRTIIRLDETGSLSGVILDTEGEAVSRARVVAVPIDLRRALPFIRDVPGWMAESGADGAYRFAELPRGNYILLAQGPKGRSAPVSAQVTSDRSLAPDLTMDVKSVVAGRVLQPGGRPVAGAVVRLQSIPTGSGEGAGEPALEAGGFLFEAARELLPELLPEATFATTDAGGRFRLPAWSQAELRVSAPGFTTADFRLANLDEGKRPVLVLASPGAVEGEVREAATGKPVAYCLVRGDRGGGSTREWAEGPFGPDPGLMAALEEDEQLIASRDSWREQLNGTTLVDDPAGRFRIDGIPPGRWRFRVQAEGYADHRSETVEVRSGEVTRGVVVELDRGATVSGRVLEFGTGQPVAGAVVTAGHGEESGFLAMLQGLGDNVAMTETDETGSFTVTGVQEGADHVNVLAEGFASASVEVEPLEAFEVREEVLVEVRLGGTITGLVTDRRGNPLPGRMVAAGSLQARDFQQTTANLQGIYRMEHMKAGSYFMFSASLDDESLFTGNIASMLTSGNVLTAYVRDGETTTVDIEDPSAGGCRVGGQILRKGQPLPGANLAAVSMEQEGLLAFGVSTTRTDADGRFEFKSLGPGEYRLNVESRAWRGQFILVVPDALEDFVTFHVPQNLVRGRVLALTSGAPVPRAGVSLVPEDTGGRGFGPFGGGGARRKWANTDEDGRFTFEELAPGRYHLEVQPMGTLRFGRGQEEDQEAAGPSLVRWKGEPFEIGEREVKDLEPVRLALAGDLKVVILDSAGAPFDEGVMLTAEALDARAEALDEVGYAGGGGLFGGGDEADYRGWGRQGEGWIRGMAPGSYRVSARSEGFSPVSREPVLIREAETTEITITMQRGVTLRVRVLSAENRPITGARIDLTDRDGAKVNDDGGIGAALARMFGADQDAAYRVGTFPPGTYNLTATWEGQRRSTSVTLIEGQDALVEIQFD